MSFVSYRRHARANMMMPRETLHTTGEHPLTCLGMEQLGPFVSCQSRDMARVWGMRNKVLGDALINGDNSQNTKHLLCVLQNSMRLCRRWGVIRERMLSDLGC